MPIKPLSFKGDKKPSKKRKHNSDSTALTTTNTNNPSTISEDDTWTSPSNIEDLTGPALLVLPSTNHPDSDPEPQTTYCLASDAHGTIFPSAIQNLVENTPHTSEPHEVRQVFICTRVPGSNEVSFKAAHGGYLASDAAGILSAKREARGLEEGWLLEEVEDDGESGVGGISDSHRTFRLRTAMSASTKDSIAEAKYLSAEPSPKSGAPPVLRADASPTSPSTHLILRMQSRFKASHQAAKAVKTQAKISRRELEDAVGRRLEDDEVKRLKRARRDGTYHEEILDVRVKGKHDKFAS